MALLDLSCLPLHILSSSCVPSPPALPGTCYGLMSQHFAWSRIAFPTIWLSFWGLPPIHYDRTQLSPLPWSLPWTQSLSPLVTCKPKSVTLWSSPANKSHFHMYSPPVSSQSIIPLPSTHAGCEVFTLLGMDHIFLSLLPHLYSYPLPFSSMPENKVSILNAQ